MSNKKRRTFILCIYLAVTVTGCSKGPGELKEPMRAEGAKEAYEEELLEGGTETEEKADKALLEEETLSQKDLDQIAAVYERIYSTAPDAAAQIQNSPELMKEMIHALGEMGYTAVDKENQVDMARSEKVTEFCGLTEEAETGNLTILVASYAGGFTAYHFKAEEGAIQVAREDYTYEEGQLKNTGTASYPAETWQYTEEGYLLFGGSYLSDGYYALELSDVREQEALRVQPLEEACREWNRTYILSVGYKRNNLFLTDWSEEDFEELNFYDVFERFYPMLHGEPAPYEADENLGVGAVYQIPAAEFEAVVQKYFSIDRENLRAKTIFSPAEGTYTYRPRGFYESEYPDIPYPEVVSYEEREDGTIALEVNAVYPQEQTSRAFAHRVVIRPLGDGGFQYVSNERIWPEEAPDLWWHAERLTVEAWKEIYEGSE